MTTDVHSAPEPAEWEARRARERRWLRRWAERVRRQLNAACRGQIFPADMAEWEWSPPGPRTARGREEGAYPALETTLPLPGRWGEEELVVIQVVVSDLVEYGGHPPAPELFVYVGEQFYQREAAVYAVDVVWWCIDQYLEEHGAPAEQDLSERDEEGGWD